MNSLRALFMISLLLMTSSCAMLPAEVTSSVEQVEQSAEQVEKAAEQVEKTASKFDRDKTGKKESKAEREKAEAEKAEAQAKKYKKSDIAIDIKADPRLNVYQGRPYALTLCLYQLKDPNSFNQLLEERDGIPRLMQCNRFDPSVANAKRVVVQPGTAIKEGMDRAEGARYIGVVAGYYSSEKQDVSGLEKMSSWNVLGYNLKINLGSTKITSFKAD